MELVCFRIAPDLSDVIFPKKSRSFGSFPKEFESNDILDSLQNFRMRTAVKEFD